MKSIRLINKFITFLIIGSMFFMVVGLSYSFYVTRLSGQETNITLIGNMEIEISGEGIATNPYQVV